MEESKLQRQALCVKEQKDCPWPSAGTCGRIQLPSLHVTRPWGEWGYDGFISCVWVSKHWGWSVEQNCCCWGPDIHTIHILAFFSLRKSSNLVPQTRCSLAVGPFCVPLGCIFHLSFIWKGSGSCALRLLWDVNQSTVSGNDQTICFTSTVLMCTKMLYGCTHHLLSEGAGTEHTQPLLKDRNCWRQWEWSEKPLKILEHIPVFFIIVSTNGDKKRTQWQEG